MNPDMQLYYDYTISPLGQVFYKTVWHQLQDLTDQKVLDFGSGFGFTANFLAQHNDVTALERDPSMIAAASATTAYTQLQGDVTTLHAFADNTFDVILCHLVLEFVDDPKEILAPLLRLLKPNGILSVVKHHKNGRIIQAVVQDYDLSDAFTLLDGGHSFSSAFGSIKYYTPDDLLCWADHTLTVEATYGVRSLASLQSAEIRANPNWVEEMFLMESRLLQQTAFVDIAYFNHLILRKSS